jgi:hypothetical protein
MAKRILLALSLTFVACAHDHALTRGDVAAMQNDSPAISPWSGPVPNETIEQGPSGVSGTELDDEWQ